MMATLFGVCELCGERTTKAAMMKHLAACVSKHDRPSGAPSELFQLRVEGKGAPLFWLDVEVKGESPIRRLEDPLRRVWLECCGHMSAFETGGLRYSVLVDNDFGPTRNERDEHAFLPVVTRGRGGQPQDDAQPNRGRQCLPRGCSDGSTC